MADSDPAFVGTRTSCAARAPMRRFHPTDAAAYGTRDQVRSKSNSNSTATQTERRAGANGFTASPFQGEDPEADGGERSESGTPEASGKAETCMIPSCRRSRTPPKNPQSSPQPRSGRTRRHRSRPVPVRTRGVHRRSKSARRQSRARRRRPAECSQPKRGNLPAPTSPSTKHLLIHPPRAAGLLRLQPFLPAPRAV